MPIYDFTVKGADGKDVSLSKYAGKVLLVVNTATACGFTPQYKGLQEIYGKLKGRGVEILDFPCNQFGHQAPGSDEEIGSFCEMKYHTTFPRFKKIDVNGEGADPLYTWLKSKKGGILGDNIKWNFTKFIIDKNGEVSGRYPSTATPAALESELEKLL
jgi:glutathione peroxidase